MKKILQYTSLFVLYILILTACAPVTGAMLAQPIDQLSTYKEAQAQTTDQVTQVPMVVHTSDGTIRIVNPKIALRSTYIPAFNGLLPSGGSVAGTAYVLDLTNKAKVVSIDASGTHELSFIQNPTYFGLAVWQGSSSAKSRLAWGTQPTGSAQSTTLQISAPDGSQHETLLTEDAPNLPLQLTPEFWSADGQSLYFSKEPVGLGGYILFGGASNLYQINITTKKVTAVITSGSSSGPQVCLDAISGDYRYVADHCSQNTITVRDLVSGGTTTIQPPREISPLFRTLGSARFSPDGRRLAFALARRNPDSEQGWVAVSDGTSGGSKLILTSQMGTYYTIAGWLDDQTLLIQSTNVLNCGLTCSSELWTVGIDGKNPQKVADGSLLTVITDGMKNYSSVDGQFSLRYPNTAIFYENQRVSVDGVVSLAENTIAIQESANGGPVLSLTYYELPSNTSLTNFVRSEKECAELANLTGQSFSLNGHSALLFPDTNCGPYGTTYLYTIIGNMGYRFTIESYENYSATGQFTSPILNSFQTYTANSATPTAVPPIIIPTPRPATPTATPVPCNQARFVKDVTVKDGTLFDPDEDFTKTWRMENTGTCTWTHEYELVFRSGEKMDGPSAVILNAKVKPGETIDISVNLTAPKKSGEYTGYWALRDEAGRIFGIGVGAKEDFWVNIVVTAQPILVYDFTANYCDATWSTSMLPVIPCPSLPLRDPVITHGAVEVDPSPMLETGYLDDEPALITNPEGGTDGYIRGHFPAVRIEDGDHFKTIVGCLYDSWNCSVILTLSYSINGGNPEQLGRWTETYDDEITRIDIDLSFLAGKKVEFIFTTRAKGANEDDWAFWLLPRIIR